MGPASDRRHVARGPSLPVAALVLGLVAAVVTGLVALGGAAAPAVADTRPGPSGQSGQSDGAGAEALILILDASGSMLRPDGSGGTRIASARQALTSLIDRLPESLDVGLRVYGHRVPSSEKARACQDSELLVPVGPLDGDRLKGAVASVQALGETPIGLSLRQAVADLPDGTPGTVILVSDGADECFPDNLGPEPCQVARELVDAGVDLRVEVVGLQVEPVGREQLACMADVTGGSFTDVDDVTELGDALAEAQLRPRRVFEVRGEPVAGGPALIDATALEPGTYRDGVLPGDVLWYAVDAEAGQELTARVTVATEGVPAEAGIELAWHDERAARVESEGVLTSGAGQASTAAVATGEVNGSRTRFGAVRDPGTYYLSVTTTGFPGGIRQPFVLELLRADVRRAAASAAAGGEATAEASGSPGDEPSLGAAAADPVELPPAPEGGSGANVLLVLLLLLLGGVGAYLYLRRRRIREVPREQPPGYV
jgi:Ca-activated chloride channel family protein